MLVEQGSNLQTLARDLPGLQHHFSAAFRSQPAQPGSAQAQTPGQYNPFASPPGPSTYPRPTSTPYSAYPAQSKSKLAAALFAFFLGSLGIHRFYLGYTGIGITMLSITMVGSFFCCGAGAIVTGVWSIIDFVLILTGQLKDISGQALD